LTVREMEKTFNWNVMQSNAFGNIRTEAQAPWGVIAKAFAEQLGKVAAEAVKAGVEANIRRKSKDDRDKKD